MKEFLKNNWFKVGILAAVLLIAVGLFQPFGENITIKGVRESVLSLYSKIKGKNLITEIPTSTPATSTPVVLGQATSAISKASPSVKEKPKSTEIKNSETTAEARVPQIATQENFNEKSITSAKGVLSELQAFTTGIDIVLKNIDDRNAVVENLLSVENQNSYTTSDDLLLKTHNLFVNAFNADLKTMAEYRAKFSNVKGFSTDNYPALNTVITTYPNKYISKEQSVLDIESHNKILSDLAVLNAKVNELINSYNNYALAQDNTYKQAFELVISKLKEMTGSNTSSNYYVPQYQFIQPIQIPKVTNCYVSYGNTTSIDCYTH